jgi:hypothetical protein
MNLTKFVFGKENQEEYEYRLFSVLIHEGFSINSGHYFSHVKNSDNSWYTMNDSWVSRTNEKNILQQTPYLLFYERVQKKHNSINSELLKSNIIKEVNTTHISPNFEESKKIGIEKNIKINNSPELIKIDNKAQVPNKEKLLYTQQTESKLSNEEVKSQPETNNSHLSSNLGDEKVKIYDDNHIGERKITSPPNNQSESEDTLSQMEKRGNTNTIKFISRKRRKLNKIIRSLKLSSLNKQPNCLLTFTDDLRTQSIRPLTVKKNQKSTLNYFEESFMKSGLNKKKEFSNLSTKNQNQIIIHNRNLTNLYGSDKIELWDTEEDSDLLKKQISFIKSVDDFKEKPILFKDDYDVNYDTGKLKKVKREKYKSNSNVFQKVHDKFTRK